MEKEEFIDNILEKKQVLSHWEKKTNAEDEKPQKTYISLDFKVISIIYISLPMTVAQISCLQFLFPHIFSNKHAEFINLLITYDIINLAANSTIQKLLN